MYLTEESTYESTTCFLMVFVGVILLMIFSPTYRIFAKESGPGVKYLGTPIPGPNMSAGHQHAQFSFAYGDICWIVPLLQLAHGAAYSPRNDLSAVSLSLRRVSMAPCSFMGRIPRFTPSIPGMRSGEVVTFKINGSSAQASPTLSWSPDKDLTRLP